MTPRTRWYDKKPDTEVRDEEEHCRLRAADLIDTTRDVEQRQHAWHELALWNSTLYTNRELPGFRWGNPEADEELWPTNLRTENIVESIGEAMLSKASQSPLKPTMVPHGTSWRIERAVRLADNFLVGVWRQVKAEDACIEAYRDSFMSALGCVRASYSKATGKLTCKSVFFDQIIIDNRECANRAAPRTYRIREVLPREVVEAEWGVTLTDKPRPYVNHRTMAEGWVPVITAWRLPDAKGKGGHYMVATCDQVLDEGPWKHDWVPLEFYTWMDRTSGFFTKSGVEQLVPYQLRQNELNDDIKLAQDIVCRPRLLVNANSMIDVNQWDNEAGRFLMYSGNKPEPFEWNTQLLELYQERERNYARAYSHMAMSEAFANADIPQQVRLDSSAGIREFQNMADTRHLRMWTRFEDFKLRVARMLMNVLSISKGADAFSAVYHPAGSRAKAKDIPYEAIREVTADQFSWTMESTPLSLMSPAARREVVRERASRGQIDPAMERQMESNPNLEMLDALEMASIDDIQGHLETLEDGDYEEPTELTNTTAGIRMVTMNYHRLRRYEDVEPMVLENHIRWIVAATAIQQSAITPPTPVPFAPTQGMPGTNATTAPAPMGMGMPMGPAPQ